MPKGKKFGVNKVIELYNEAVKEVPGQNFPDAWIRTKEAFTEAVQKSGENKDIGQTWKTSSGKAFERIAIEEVLKMLRKEEFYGKDIEGKRWCELSKKQKENMSHYFERRCTGEKILLSSEPDIVIYVGGRPRIILSCKSSLRDRVSMDLFWAEKYRDTGKIFILVSAETSGRIGTHLKPNKPRMIAECLYDGLYIVNGQTDYCKIVRPFSDLEKDLAEWLN